MDKRENILLRIETPKGVAAEVECDEVTLTMAADENGHKGGEIGILKNFADSVIALKPGPASAKKGGSIIWSGKLDAGFASVSSNVVTVLTQTAVSDAAQSQE